MKNAIFVDLSNFYGSCLKSKLCNEEIIRGYFVDWLDFDRLAYYLTNEWSPVWVFYSKDRVGPSDFRIEKDYLQSMIDRFNRQRGVTARDVNIPGEQRERYEFECEKCHTLNKTESVGEKGVDASLTVHLFETMDTWDTAYLLSGDADFVPVVSSLRRLGKNVITVSSQNTSSALIRESYDIRNLDYEFLNEDLLAYRLFCKNGFIDRWFTKSEGDTSGSGSVTMSFYLTENENFIPLEDISHYMGTGSNQVLDKKINLHLVASNLAKTEMENRAKAISEFFQNSFYGDYFTNRRHIKVPFLSVTGLGITRRLEDFMNRNPHITKRSAYIFHLDFE